MSSVDDEIRRQVEQQLAFEDIRAQLRVLEGRLNDMDMTDDVVAAKERLKDVERGLAEVDEDVQKGAKALEAITEQLTAAREKVAETAGKIDGIMQGSARDRPVVEVVQNKHEANVHGGRAQLNQGSNFEVDNE